MTVINSEGKPTQVPASSLNMSAAIQGGATGFTPNNTVVAGIYYLSFFITHK